MAFTRDFRAFIARGNVIDLAVAVVIGAAFGKIVSALVDGIFMPLVGGLLPGKSWEAYEVTSLHLKLGLVLARTVDFLVIALVVFLVVQKGLGALRHPPATAAAPATRSCPECLETIPIAARRCRACTSILPAADA